MFNGDFFKSQSIVSESDIADLTRFNEAVKGGIPYLTAIEQEMSKSSETAKNLAKSAKGATVDINSIPKASKAAAAGMKALSVAGNMLVSMGIAFAITKIIEGIQWLATASERAKEAAAELTDELNAQKTTIEGNVSTISGLEDEFERLSKGVDDYGANISLSADEYARYQQVVQQIVGISPSLISGYDKEGNAIANKNGLIEQSIALLKEENRQRIINATSEETVKTLGKGEIEKYKDIYNDYQENKSGALSSYGGLIKEMTDPGAFGSKNSDEYKKGKFIADFFGVDESSFGQNYRSLNELISKADFDEKIEELYDRAATARDIFTTTDLQKFKDYIDQRSSLSLKLETASKSLNPTLQMVPQSLTVYDELTDKQKAFISEYVNTFRITADTTESDIENMRQDILDFTEAIGKASPETKKAVEDLFSLDKTKISAAEWEKQVNDLINQIVNSLTFDSDEDKNNFVKNLKIRLGIEFTTDGETTVDTMISNIEEKFGGKFADEIRKLKIDDLKMLSNLDISPEGIEDWAEVETLIANAKRVAEGTTGSLQKVAQELSTLQSRYKELKSAQDEYNSTGAISAETMQKLISNNLLQYLDYSSGKLKINTAALLAEGEAAKVNAIQKLQDAAATDLMILAGTKTGEMSNTAKTAIENMGNAAEETGNQAETAAGKLLNFAAGAWAAAGLDPNAQSEDFTAKASAILSAYQNIANTIGSLTIKDPKTSGSDKNEALDNYLKDAENRYKIHQDEVKYIQELQHAYDNLTKNEKERLDITGKINEAYRDLADNRIKDLEHQIDLKKELYGDDYNATAEWDEIQNIAHEEANRLRAMGYDDNSNEIQNLQKAWWDAQNSKLDFYNKQHENIIRDIEHARDMALSTNPFADTTSYYKQMQNEYHIQAERLRALDPEKYKEEIQELQQAWWDAQEAIADWSYSNSENWISERNTYNDWDLYGDNEVDAWERVLKRFKTEFPNELEKIKEIEQNIFEARKEAMEKSIDDIEDYIDARNTYNDWDAYGDSEVKAIQRQTKIIEDMYNQRLLSYEEYIDRLEEQSQRIYSLAQDEIDKNLSSVDKYIDARNHFNDWDEFGDSEIKAIKRQIQYLDAAYKQKLISYEDYTERVAEYTQKMYSVAKDSIIEEVSKLIEDYEEMKNLESSQLESQKTLLQSYYDVTNAIAEAQREINKELKASMTMHEYLNEETRESLFNQEDYNALNKELLDIQTAADELQKQYQEDILNANAETIAEITSQYQMQYETMMKQYEIAKAELDVAKKRQKLDNVLAERNVRMFINGQWQWVASTQNVIDAQNELAEAEAERERAEASLEQTDAINDFTERINSLETDLNQVRKYWSDMQEMLNGESEEVAKALQEISQVSSPELKRVIEATGGTVTSFSASLSVNTKTMSETINSNMSSVSLGISGFVTSLRGYSDAIMALAAKISSANTNTGGSSSGSSSVSAIKAQMAANSAAWHTASASEKKKLEQENQKLGASIGSTYNSASGTWTHKYADGTRYTSGGMTLMGEEGFEAFISNSGRLIPINQPTIGNIGAGGVVFNREQMANLRNLWDLSNIGKISPFISSSNANSQSTVIDNSIHINGLTVGEQGNEDWINGFRRYVATHK